MSGPVTTPSPDSGGGVCAADITWGNVAKWRNGPVDAASAAVKKKIDAIIAESDAYLTATDVTDWTGTTAEASTAKRASVCDAFEELAADLSVVQRALGQAADEIAILETTVKDIVSTARADELSIADDGTVSDAKTPPKLPDATSAWGYTHGRQRKLDVLSARVEAALAQAALIDRLLCTNLTNIANGKRTSEGATSVQGAIDGAAKQVDTTIVPPSGLDAAARKAWLDALPPDVRADVTSRYPRYLAHDGLGDMEVSSEESKLRIRANVGLATVEAEGTATLVQSVDDTGKTVWQVRLQGDPKAGAGVGYGTEMKGYSQSSADVVQAGALFGYRGGARYDFDSEAEARAYYDKVRNDPRAFVDGVSSAFRRHADTRVVDGQTGHDRRSEITQQTTYQLEVSAAVNKGPFSLEGEGVHSGAFGTQYTNEDGTAVVTKYETQNWQASAQAGITIPESNAVPSVARPDIDMKYPAGSVGYSGTIQGGSSQYVTYRNGQPSTVTYELTYETSAGMSGGKEWDPGPWKQGSNTTFGGALNTTAEGGRSVTERYELDLSNPENRRAFENGETWGLIANRVQAAGPGDGVSATRMIHDVQNMSGEMGASTSEGLRYGGEAELSQTKKTLNAAMVWDPTQRRWVPWERTGG